MIRRPVDLDALRERSDELTRIHPSVQIEEAYPQYDARRRSDIFIGSGTVIPITLPNPYQQGTGDISDNIGASGNGGATDISILLTPPPAFSGYAVLRDSNSDFHPLGDRLVAITSTAPSTFDPVMQNPHHIEFIEEHISRRQEVYSIIIKWSCILLLFSILALIISAECHHIKSLKVITEYIGVISLLGIAAAIPTITIHAILHALISRKLRSQNTLPNNIEITSR